MSKKTFPTSTMPTSRWPKSRSDALINLGGKPPVRVGVVVTAVLVAHRRCISEPSTCTREVRVHTIAFLSFAFVRRHATGDVIFDKMPFVGSFVLFLPFFGQNVFFCEIRYGHPGGTCDSHTN